MSFINSKDSVHYRGVCCNSPTQLSSMEKLWVFLFALIALSLYFWCTFIALAMFEVTNSKSIQQMTTELKQEKRNGNVHNLICSCVVFFLGFTIIANFQICVYLIDIETKISTSEKEIIIVKS